MDWNRWLIWCSRPHVGQYISMIREATDFDIPVIVGMVRLLHASARMAMPIDEAVVHRTLRSLILNPQGLLIVSGREPEAFLAASMGLTSVSAAPVAYEHGWWASPKANGAGIKLLLWYERWAKEQGCAFVRMCTPPDNDRAALLLERRGFFLSEQVWVRAI